MIDLFTKAVWYYMDAKTVSGYGPWVRKVDHDAEITLLQAALAAKDAETSAAVAAALERAAKRYGHAAFSYGHRVRVRIAPDATAALKAERDAKDALIRELVAAVTHEREMVCQDLGMQLAAGEAVDAALAKAREAGYE